jgi:phosphate transport system substrate-binding protein
LFSGTASQWSAVGGGAGAVNTLIRVSTSGTQASFETLYLKGAKAKGSPLFSNGAIRSKVKNDVNAVGAVTGAYIEGFKGVCGVKIDGVAPTLKNVSNGKFKFWTFQYLVTKGAPAGDAKAFVDFARSKAFQNKYVSKFAVPVGNAPPVNT